MATAVANPAEILEVGEQEVIWPYRFEILPISQLFIDEAYQRPLSRFFRNIADHFDPALLGTLVASQRGKKKYAVVDGQTRLAAIDETSVTDKVPCLVYTGLTQAQEADLFARFQTERRPIRPLHRFRADVVAKKEMAIDIDRIIAASGFHLAEPANQYPQIQAISALEQIYKIRGPEVLTRTLRVIHDAWPDQFASSGEMLKGVSYFLHRTANVDDDRLILSLSANEPVSIIRRAQLLREGRGHTSRSARFIAEVIRAEYRRRGRKAPVGDARAKAVRDTEKDKKAAKAAA